MSFTDELRKISRESYVSPKEKREQMERLYETLVEEQANYHKNAIKSSCTAVARQGENRLDYTCVINVEEHFRLKKIREVDLFGIELFRGRYDQYVTDRIEKGYSGFCAAVKGRICKKLQEEGFEDYYDLKTYEGRSDGEFYAKFKIVIKW